MNDIDLLNLLLKKSLVLFYANDAVLLKKTGAERTCQGRIMVYMEHLLKHDPLFEIWRYYNLDCEYHWDKHDQKRYANRNGYMQPDLMLHIRNTNEHNLMVIEFKFEAKTSDGDSEKLRDLTKSDYIYKYKLGCAVSLNVQGPIYKYFIDGQETQI